jgi:hypothetical protein
MAWLRYLYWTEGHKLVKGDRKDIEKILSNLNAVSDNDEVKKRIIEDRRIDKQHFYFENTNPTWKARKTKNWEAFFIDFKEIQTLFRCRDYSLIEII